MVNISGPDLHVPLIQHSMVPLGHGQVILGGFGDNNVVQSKIYSIKYSQQVWHVTILEKELQIPRGMFMAIPIPDQMSGCISESKFIFYL